MSRDKVSHILATNQNRRGIPASRSLRRASTLPGIGFDPMCKVPERSISSALHRDIVRRAPGDISTIRNAAVETCVLDGTNTWYKTVLTEHTYKK